MTGSGVSPVLASLLLVVIAVAAALATYVWVSSYLRSAERGVETPQFRELLKVEGVRAGDGGVIVTVRNIGSAKLVLRAVYVLKGDVAVAAEKLDLELEPGQVADVRVSAGVQPGDYTVKVVTARGVEASARLPFSGTTRQPKFLIVSWSLDVAGPVSSKREFSSMIKNVGSGEGSVRVEVHDHNGVLINSSTLTLQPGGAGLG